MTKRLEMENGEIHDFGKLNDLRHGCWGLKWVQLHGREEVRVVFGV